jgi:glycine oxidase
VAKALRAALEEAGGELRSGAPVERVRIEHGRVAGVDTDRGFAAAARVVIAAGAWSDRVEGLLAPARPPVRPVAGQMLALMMDPSNPLLRHVAMVAGGYLVPRRDGRLLVGATSEERGFDGRHTARGLALLAAILAAGLPAALDLPIEESWVGFRPGSPDDRPILGPTPVDGLVLATGHGHNGILMAPATIEAVCVGLITGEWDESLRPFMLDRFG